MRDRAGHLWRTAAVIVAALVCCAPAAARAPRTIKESGTFRYLNTSQGDACSWGIGIEFATIPDAVSYTVTYYDGYYKMDETTGLSSLRQLQQANAPLDALGVLSPHTNFVGVTGGSYSPPCQSGGGDATEGGRFSKGATVTATLGHFTISGTVSASKCTSRSCSLKPEAGVTVVASDHGTDPSATTNAHGHYKLSVDAGDYDVKLRGVKGLPEVQSVHVAANVRNVDFRTCADDGASGDARAAGVTPFGFRCDRTIVVSVFDLRGNALPGVRVLASATGTFDVTTDAVATTDAQGIARLDVYDTTWDVFLAQSLETLQPDGTVVFPGGFEPSNEFPGSPYVYVSSCAGGSPRRGGEGCAYDLAIGKHTGATIEMSARVDVAPVNVTLGAGLGTGTVLIEPEGTDQVLTWHGAGAPRNRLRFEAPLANPATVDVLASAGHYGNGGMSTITSCTPGAVGTTASVPLIGTACRLTLSPTGANTGSVSFGAS